MKAYYIFQQADEQTISDILDWMRNQERAIYRAAVRELGALKKLRPEFIQRKPLQEQFSFIKKMLGWKPSNEIGDHLLQVWLLRKHQDMLITFLNTLGIPHDGNGIVNELPETPSSQMQALAFAVQELALYLDTHRDDREALELYRRYQQLLEKVRAEYQKRFGPLNHGTPQTSESYQWLDDPWPWEYTTNKEA